MSSLKKGFDQISFQNQLLIVFIIGFASVIFFITLAITWVANSEISKNFELRGRALTKTFIHQSTSALLFQSDKTAEERINLLKGYPHVVEAAIYTDTCRLLYKKIQQPFFEPKGGTTKCHYSEIMLDYEDSHYWQFAAPVFYHPPQKENIFGERTRPQPTELVGYVRILITKDGKNGLNEIRKSITFSSIFIGLLIGLILFSALQLMSRRMVKPLQSLSDTMHHAMNGALGMRATPSGAKEIRQIGSSFNTMLSVLEEREDELKVARDAAMESARVKSEFAANVSHEIRTPMHGIFGLLRLLRDMELTGEQREYVDMANESTEKLFDLINDILDFSKITEGQLQLENTDVNIQNILEDIITDHSSAKKSRKIEITSLVDSNIPKDLEGDPTRIRQIFHNFVSNSIKFTEEGEVILSAALIKDEGHFVVIRFTIKDTGVGIAAEARDKIFDAYSQQDGSTSRKYGGTGLGLAISKKLIEAMHGTVTLNSKVGEGSEFKIEIPINRALKAKQIEKELPKWRGMHALQLAPVGLQLKILDNLCEHQMLDHNWINRPEKLIQTITEKNANYNMLLINWDDNINKQLDELNDLKKKGKHIPIIQLVRKHEEIDRHPAVDIYLRKPIKQSAVKKALTEALNENDWEAPKVYEYDLKKPTKPQTTNEEKKTNKPNTEKEKNNDLKILIVEDNITNQVVVTAALKKMNITPDIAENGQEAIEAYKRCQYALIIMDIQMPVMGGFEATRKIREMEPSGQHVPIIALTANVASSDANKCLECGMDDFLAKPFRLQHLESMLKIWLGETFTATVEESTAHST